MRLAGWLAGWLAGLLCFAVSLFLRYYRRLKVIFFHVLYTPKKKVHAPRRTCYMYRAVCSSYSSNISDLWIFGSDLRMLIVVFIFIFLHLCLRSPWVDRRCHCYLLPRCASRATCVADFSATCCRDAPLVQRVFVTR